MAATVTYGLFATFTAAELATEWTKYKTAVQSSTNTGGKSIVSATVGGKSFTYDYPEGITSLTEWRRELEAAQRQLDDEDPIPLNRTAMRYGQVGNG